jgi:hypothetical protein
MLNFIWPDYVKAWIAYSAERPEYRHQRIPAANAHNPRRSIESTSLGEGTADADTSDCGGI